jgi:simple sugar transport system ATP-binding protein
MNLQVYEGEIVGVAGVAGNGQPELAAVATGMMPPFAGKVIVRGKDLTKKSPEDFIKAGVGHIPEEMAVGMAMRESVEMNAVMKSLDEPALNAWLGLNLGRLRQFAVDLMEAAGLTGIKPKRKVNTLSGGQMQRLLVQRELRAGGRVLVAVHPSRGLDVGATEAVHAKLIDAVEKGAAVLLISEDLDEVLKLSDRIVVLYEGGVQGRYSRAEADRKTLGLLMGGAHVRDAQKG